MPERRMGAGAAATEAVVCQDIATTGPCRDHLHNVMVVRAGRRDRTATEETSWTA
jgi:hypothetical protein